MRGGGPPGGGRGAGAKWSRRGLDARPAPGV